MEAAHDEYTSQYVYDILTGWWWDRHENDGPPQDGALNDDTDTESGSAYTASITTGSSTNVEAFNASWLFFVSCRFVLPS